jgi:hypothetical protein
MRNQVVSRLESAEQLFITTLGIDLDEVNELVDSFEHISSHDQIIALLDIDLEENLPKEKPPLLRQDLWEYIAHPEETEANIRLKLTRVSLLLFILEIESTLFFIHAGHFDSAIKSFGDACEHYGSTLAHISAMFGPGSSHMLAKTNGEAKHRKTNQAKAFVRAEWHKHREAYEGNKSAFTRDYVKRVLHEFDATVTEKQMREVWLRDTPAASKPDGLPADGE